MTIGTTLTIPANQIIPRTTLLLGVHRHRGRNNNINDGKRTGALHSTGGVIL